MSNDKNPNVWGKSGWFFMKSIASAYPSRPTIVEKENYKNFFNNIGNVLPCSLCSENWNRHLQINPLTETQLFNNYQLFKWVNDQENLVKILNNKDPVSYQKSVEEFNNKYLNYNRDNLDNKTKFFYFVIILLIGILLFFIIWYFFGSKFDYV